ncbi:MAG TPA: F0F1 ATP synthase subunit delta [Mycobacteriales bacterium]|nr:F0F1 ATP synthase subunit delta [Mycobacteriales bacterium]
MLAASRAALKAAQDRLDEHLDGLPPATMDELADELLAVVDLLDREPEVRRLLTDPGAPPDARIGLFDRLVGGKLTPAVLDQLRPLVGDRWSRPGDLADTIELLAFQAILAVAERAGELDEVQDELFRFGRIVAGQLELRRVLADQTAPADGRGELLHRLVGGKVHAAAERLLARAVQAPRGLQLEVALERLVELAAQRRERYVAYVRTAAALTEAQQSRLAETLSRIYRRSIDVVLEIDPELLGGLVVRVNDEVIDGSVAHRLAAARRLLAG